ncbi:tetrapyrrole biosynthesis, uroporphyrinogen III synthase [Bimuria novae-zelandiae CBS 107.79]|uniref:Tetrapyrrole biosynthesis, uroporphyrinogen III synthase n=1 Tax=Bimuria novae-zelandiae CBS 107.79 TaxID=1447943 RepID=A0A6A5VW23_9PLEO|nr:tetrapyrrole biosynthesis, uroporphyrinogen III synthase [Bimuria novae-zelandiae CBS 107.79]
MPPSNKIPVLLLKTKSAPTDAYEECFNALDDGKYEPIFVPVLEHRFKQAALDQVYQHIIDRAFIGDRPKYGAIIFTSQRAVEAFARIVEEIRRKGPELLEACFPSHTPLYVVGPATARGLKSLNLHCPVLGEETGNGEVLAAFILKHYNTLYKGDNKPGLLFLVGDKRRDIIPTTLQSPELGTEERLGVDELEIYETGEMRSFKSNFTSIWQENTKKGVRQWVVVFSPSGCKAMLESLGFARYEDNKSVKPLGQLDDEMFKFATIGPTTYSYLVQECGFVPNAVAQSPSAEGLAEAIQAVEKDTRSATRNDSSPKKEEVKAGTKRKADAASPKGSRKATKQSTIEETLAGNNTEQPPKDPADDAEMKDAAGEDGNDQMGEDPAKTEAEPEEEETVKAEGGNEKSGTQDGGKNQPVQESSQREKKIASNILEKGIIYFFTRNRVGIEDSDSVGDLQRTYFVLRPLPLGTKLGEGALPDLENNRLFALPKKVFPKSHTDRFMAFVEKANTTIQDLKDNFFRGEQYETKTMGTRRTEPVATVAEGVYFITRTDDRTTHFVYAITIPSEIGEVQEDLGLRSQGSFVISVKNPERGGPSYANLPQGPDFPKEIIEEFRGLAWSEVKPKYLDYANVQILLIGENTEKAVEATTKDQKHDKDSPKEELEKFEHEDELRVEHLHGDDSIFDDLKISREEYSKVPTTW